MINRQLPASLGEDFTKKIVPEVAQVASKSLRALSKPDYLLNPYKPNQMKMISTMWRGRGLLGKWKTDEKFFKHVQNVMNSPAARKGGHASLGKALDHIFGKGNYKGLPLGYDKTGSRAKGDRKVTKVYWNKRKVQEALDAEKGVTKSLDQFFNLKKSNDSADTADELMFFLDSIANGVEYGLTLKEATNFGLDMVSKSNDELDDYLDRVNVSGSVFVKATLESYRIDPVSEVQSMIDALILLDNVNSLETK